MSMAGHVSVKQTQPLQRNLRTPVIHTCTCDLCSNISWVHYITHLVWRNGHFSVVKIWVWWIIGYGRANVRRSNKSHCNCCYWIYADSCYRTQLNTSSARRLLQKHRYHRKILIFAVFYFLSMSNLANFLSFCRYKIIIHPIQRSIKWSTLDARYSSKSQWHLSWNRLRSFDWSLKYQDRVIASFQMQATQEWPQIRKCQWVA